MAKKRPEASARDVSAMWPHHSPQSPASAAELARIRRGQHRGESLVSDADSRNHREVPYLLLAGVVAMLTPLRVALGPISDIDLYWHLLVGRDILAGTPVADAGHGWSFSPVPDTWVSTQWLAETLFAKLEAIGGLDTLVVYRTFTFVAALAVLAAVTLRHRPARAGVWLFTLGSLTLMLYTEERSQQLTFILAPLVGWWIERLWRTGRLPRWWLVLPLVAVWSNFHGGWVLLPLGLVLAALARLLDHGWRDRAIVTSLLLAGATLAAACVSPSGWGNALASMRFSANTGLIDEWHAVRVWDALTIPFLLAILIVIVAWARGRMRPSRGEIAIVLTLITFGFMAWRDMTPALLMLSPVATGIVARALGDPDPPPARAPFGRVAIALGLVGAVAALTLAAVQNRVVAPDTPRGLIAQIKNSPGDQRVLNTYNIAGPLLWLAGGPPHVQVAIDGRADRYGAARIDAYIRAFAAQPGWETLVDEIAPTYALLHSDEALGPVLVVERHWVEVGREGRYVLLRAPGSSGQSGAAAP